MDYVVISIVDLYGPTLRSQLGMSPVGTITYRYSLSLDTSSNSTASAADGFITVSASMGATGSNGSAPGAGGLWNWLLPSPALGYWWVPRSQLP